MFYLPYSHIYAIICSTIGSVHTYIPFMAIEKEAYREAPTPVSRPLLGRSVLVINGSAVDEGDVRVQRTTARAMRDLGAEIRVLSRAGDAADKYKADDFPVTTINAPRVHHNKARQAIELGIFLAKGYPMARSADAIHTHDRTLGVQAAFTLARVNNKGIFKHVNNAYMFGDPSQNGRYKLADSLDRNHYLWISRYVEAEARKAGVKGPGSILLNSLTSQPSSMSKEDAREALGIPVGQRAAVVVGRLNQHKGQDVFLHALADKRVRELGVHGYIVGNAEGADGEQYEKKLHELVPALGIADTTHFLGRRDGNMAFRAATVAVVPTRGRGEPFGLVGIEASANGAPVISTKNGAALEIFTHNKTGLLVEPDNPQALADALVDLFRHPRKGCSLAAAASHDHKWKFSYGRFVQDLAGIVTSDAGRKVFSSGK